MKSQQATLQGFHNRSNSVLVVYHPLQSFKDDISRFAYMRLYIFIRR